jgi:hypothetical protein
MRVFDQAAALRDSRVTAIAVRSDTRFDCLLPTLRSFELAAAHFIQIGLSIPRSWVGLPQTEQFCILRA